LNPARASAEPSVLVVGIVQLTLAVPVVVPLEEPEPELELDPELELEPELEPELDEVEPEELDPEEEVEPEEEEVEPEEEEVEPELELEPELEETPPELVLESAAVVVTASPPPQPESRTAHAATGSMKDTERARVFNSPFRFINDSFDLDNP
jgi:hypothetical protein